MEQALLTYPERIRRVEHSKRRAPRVCTGGERHRALGRNGIIPRSETNPCSIVVNIRPSLLTAALAGVLAALAWPYLWSRFGGAAASGTTELVVGTLLVIAVPAHAFVVGMGPSGSAEGRGVDLGLLKRIGAWLAAACAVTLLRPLLGF